MVVIEVLQPRRLALLRQHHLPERGDPGETLQLVSLHLRRRGMVRPDRHGDRYRQFERVRNAVVAVPPAAEGPVIQKQIIVPERADPLLERLFVRAEDEVLRRDESRAFGLEVISDSR